MNLAALANASVARLQQHRDELSQGFQSRGAGGLYEFAALLILSLMSHKS